MALTLKQRYFDQFWLKIGGTTLVQPLLLTIDWNNVETTFFIDPSAAFAANNVETTSVTPN